MSALVLGIGNVLWADEGYGVRALEALHAGWRLPDEVALIDGGTQGIYLLEHLCSASHAIVFDAIDYGLPPGSLRVFRDAEVPVWTDQAMSLHQATFQELLALAHLRDRYPQRLTVIGVQPQTLDDLGGSLSRVVRERIPQAVEIAVAELASWGIVARPRGHEPAEALSPSALALADYEAGRPDAEAACRIGDSRFLNPAKPVDPVDAAPARGG